MGLWATYVIGPEREDPPAAYLRYGGTAPGWTWWELPSRGREDDAALAGAGPAIVAHIMDSDVADLRGLLGGRLQWRWVDGEDVLATYEERDPELDVDWQGRASTTAGLIADWAVAAGLGNPEPAALAKVLLHGHAFAEEGVLDLFRALGLVIDDRTVEQPLEPTEINVCELPPVVPPPAADNGAMVGVRAAELDRTSRAWCDLVATRWLHTLGEPAAVVAVDTSVYVASDPPLLLGDYAGTRESVALSIGLTGAWREVPGEHAESVVSAAAWAREHIGTWGRPPDSDRLPLNVEVVPEYPPEPTRSDGWNYSIADPPTLAIELATGAPLTDRADAAADWLDRARSRVVKPVVRAYEDQDGHIQHGDADHVAPYAMLVRATHRTASGQLGATPPDEAGWAWLLRRIRAGELTSVTLTVGLTDGYGRLGQVQPWGTLHVGVDLAADLAKCGLPAHLTVRLPDPLWQLAGRQFPDDAPCDELVLLAAESLPVVGGWIDVARSLRMGNDLSRYEAFAGVRPGTSRDPRTCSRGPAWRLILGPDHLRLLGGRETVERTGLFEVVHEVQSIDDRLLILQCAESPADCTPERRAAMAAALAAIMPGGRSAG